METLLSALVKEYGPWFLIVYIFFRDGYPALLRTIEKLVPAKIKERELVLANQLEKSNAQDDLKEREVVAQEMIGKNLILLAERVENTNNSQAIIMKSLEQANKGLAILLDRRGNMRSESK